MSEQVETPLNTRVSPVRALHRAAVLAFLLCAPSYGASVDPPIAAIERISAERVRVILDGGTSASGYNLYRDGRYLTTVRPPNGVRAFPVTAGTPGGTFCVVAFEESAETTSYSTCSVASVVEPGGPGQPDTEPPAPPAAPTNLRSIVYSRGTAELFWDAAAGGDTVVGYRVRRGAMDPLEIDGRSLFQPGLDPDTLYRYQVSAIDDEGREGPAASIALRAVVQAAPPPPSAGGNPPAPPRRFRGVAFSPGVVETYWDASPDENAIAGYALSRDGAPIAFIRGRSVFETGLEPDRLYSYTLEAIGESGARSQPQVIALRARPEPPPTIRRTLRLKPESLSLVEGDESGTSTTVHLSRAAGDTDRFRLSVLDADGTPLEDLQARFDPVTLDGDESVARLTLSLPLSMGPRLPEQRALLLRVDDGENVLDAPFVLDIEPTVAPDVYLMIGQSNMEGYSEKGTKQAGPGQPDEPVERLRQINVQPNNARFFPDPDSYVSEAANFAEPLFIRAEDPLHDRLFPGQPAKSGSFVGLSLTFGKAALADTVREVYLVPAAWGATGFCANANGARAWNAAPSDNPALGGTLLLDRALLRLAVTLRESGGILRGILWHQGGADSNDRRCSETYAENLVAMVRRLREEARPDARGPSARGPRAPIPFVLATQSRGRDERGDFSLYNPMKIEVDAVHRRVAELLPHADVVLNDDLVPPAYPCGQSSCVHFGSLALREQGRRFHTALERIRARHVAGQ